MGKDAATIELGEMLLLLLVLLVLLVVGARDASPSHSLLQAPSLVSYRHPDMCTPF